MNLARSGAVFVIAYLVLVIPTFILPYTGSNSSVAGALSTSVAGGVLPQTWMHIGCLLALALLTWMRGALAGKTYIVIFPILAGIADMVPGFSLIPLLPSLFHVIGIVLGLRCAPLQLESLNESDASKYLAAGSRRTLISAAVLGVFAVVATIRSFAVIDQLEPGRQTSAVSQAPKTQAPTLLVEPKAATRSQAPLTVVTPGSPPPSVQAAPSLGTDQAGPDPALALSADQKVDPSGTTITTGGFAGLKVGHTLQEARTFFRRELVDQEYCGGGNPKWTLYSPKDMSDVILAVNTGRVVAFWITSNRFQTRSGLKVGDPETRLLELFGKDPTLERKTYYRESGGYHQIEYNLGRQSPASMRMFVKDGNVTDLMFGSSRETSGFGVPC